MSNSCSEFSGYPIQPQIGENWIGWDLNLGSDNLLVVQLIGGGDSQIWTLLLGTDQSFQILADSKTGKFVTAALDEFKLSTIQPQGITPSKFSLGFEILARSTQRTPTFRLEQIIPERKVEVINTSNLLGNLSSVCLVSFASGRWPGQGSLLNWVINNPQTSLIKQVQPNVVTGTKESLICAGYVTEMTRLNCSVIPKPTTIPYQSGISNFVIYPTTVSPPVVRPVQPIQPPTVRPVHPIAPIPPERPVQPIQPPTVPPQPITPTVPETPTTLPGMVPKGNGNSAHWIIIVIVIILIILLLYWLLCRNK